MPTLSELGITKAKENQLAARNIFTPLDLAMYLPRGYKDYTQITGLLPDAELSCVRAEFGDIRSSGFGNRTLVQARCSVIPTGENLRVLWFNQPWMSKKIGYLVGKDVLVAGKAIYSPEYGNYTISNPDIFDLDREEYRRIVPVYRKIPGMSRDYLHEKITAALSLPEVTREILPPDVVQGYGQLSRKEALIYIHNPATMEQAERGRERILFEDLLYMAVNTAWSDRKSSKGSPFSVRSLRTYHKICDTLPYELTEDQVKAIDRMTELLKDGRRINALLQGDVGCGKSIVAFIMMALMADSGYQAVIMAPTQVLAHQHYDDLVPLMEPLGFRVGYLGGSEMKAAEKRKLTGEIASGEVQIIVGTHAVISKSVEYRNLGLVIADEEHRFGVLQREALVEKASAGVHSITMSATPIPRSLAQVVYGDSIQLLTIKTMPKDRKPVITGLATGRKKIYRFILKEARAGRQTYVVCPMIDKNEDMAGVRSVEEISAEYSAALEPHGVTVETLTGRNTKDETAGILERFKNGQTQVLIATTVVEVGVNVPTATTMVISNAERFGLASLHQLRGRVGRGEFQSYCVLESDPDYLAEHPDSAARLQAMCDTTDGFRIAEADLRLRGAGDFIGTAQSGDNKYVHLMLAYPDKYKTAQEIAEDLLDREEVCEFVTYALDAGELPAS